MPINYQEIYTQIKQVGQGAKERRRKKRRNWRRNFSKPILLNWMPCAPKWILPGRQTPIFAARFLWMKPSPLTTPHLILFQRL